MFRLVIFPFVYYSRDRKKKREEKIGNKRKVVHEAETSVT